MRGGKKEDVRREGMKNEGKEKRKGEVKEGTNVRRDEEEGGREGKDRSKRWESW